MPDERPDTMVLDDAGSGSGSPAISGGSGPGAVHQAGPSKKQKRAINQSADAADDDNDEDEGDGAMAESALQTITLSEGGVAPQWVKMFPVGRYQHPKGTLNFDDAFHQRVSSNLNSGVRQIEICIDTDHENKAANGWVDRAEYRPGDGTYVHVRKWTPLGEQRIRDEEYKYVSPQFGTYSDAKTGKAYPDTLIALSLTNFPYLKDLPGVGTVSLSELTLADTTATKRNPDPDHDGDDDSTESGDTDHDYTGPDGDRKPKAKGKPKQQREPQATACTEHADHSVCLNHPNVPQEDCAGPDHTFPIETRAQVKSAWDLAGHAADPGAVKRRIKAIAGRKGWSDALPDTAKADTAASEDTQRGRKMPDENPTPQDVVSLAEHRQLLERHGEMATRLSEMQRRLDEQEVDSGLRSLSEPRTVTLTSDDGAATVRTVNTALPAVALAEARTLILDNIALREPVMRLLRSIQEHGLVSLGEQGRGRVDEEHDPYALNDDDPDGGRAFIRAQTSAKAKSLDWTSLSEYEKTGLIMANMSPVQLAEYNRFKGDR